MLQALPENFFAEQPFPSGEWLVLIDALDEVADPGARRRLLEAVNRGAAHPLASFRCVLTTRPLDGYPGLQPSRFGRYALQPFRQEQVRAFAGNWFRDRPGTHPDDARRFLQRVEESRVVELSPVPLLLTMAAVLYEEDRERPLPTGHTALYASFINLLLDGKRSAKEARADFIEVWQAHWGDEAPAEWRDKLFNERRELLQHLALWQQEGNKE